MSHSENNRTHTIKIIQSILTLEPGNGSGGLDSLGGGRLPR